MTKWYAVMKDSQDCDWGTGSHDYGEALQMARRSGARSIATIDEDTNVCLDETRVRPDVPAGYEWKYVRGERGDEFEEVLNVGNEVEAIMKALEELRGLHPVDLRHTDSASVQLQAPFDEEACWQPDPVIYIDLLDLWAKAKAMLDEDNADDDDDEAPSRFDQAVELMDDDLREYVHGLIAGCSEFIFLAAYMYEHEVAFGEEFRI